VNAHTDVRRRRRRRRRRKIKVGRDLVLNSPPPPPPPPSPPTPLLAPAALTALFHARNAAKCAGPNTRALRKLFVFQLNFELLVPETTLVT